ncbi:putative anion transporter 2, chloroplastic [Hordeum vulgare]|nr:putative anion transporter 2, chloroplastic [Hordeum vulgare]
MGPALEQLASIQAKEILDGCLVAAQARAMAEIENPSAPRSLARGEVGPLPPVEICGRTQPRTLLQHRTISASSALRHMSAWHWLPVGGWPLGGILLGVKDTTFDVGSMNHGEFFVSMEVWERTVNFKREVIVVYGTADHTRSEAFLDEMHQKIEAASLPLIIVGDFNLTRSPLDKNNAQVDVPGMQWFNDWIADLGIRELD